MDDPIVSRDEVVALFFNVSDILQVLLGIESLLKEDDGEEGNES